MLPFFRFVLLLNLEACYRPRLLSEWFVTAPTRAQNLTGLPPCYSDVGNFDLFREENAFFFDRLAQSGVTTEFKVFSGAFHGSENLAPESELSKAIWKKRFSALKQFIEM